jgi:uracil-DNA glycosylase
MRTLADLLAAVEAEARRAPFPIDEPVYAAAGKDPLAPVLCAGSLDAPLCSVGRDLGRDEVVAGEPQVGAAGRQVRGGVVRVVTGKDAAKSDRRLELALDHILLTNLVPYKPPGNKAYPRGVRERFRPFLLELLVDHWRGERVVTLGTEAFEWFAPYLPEGAGEAFWARGDRYEAEIAATLRFTPPGEAGERTRRVIVCPLPHPSPLNQRWYALFPELLARRLEAAGLSRS